MQPRRSPEAGKMPRGVFVVVLCEGLQDWVFARRALSTMGCESHEFRVLKSPKGRGAGEQFVRENFPMQLQAFRARAARRKTILVVCTDADKLTVEARRRTLEDALRAEGIAQRDAREPVAILIPRRNIETWIHHLLDGVGVDEEITYPKYEGHESDAWPAADEFARRVMAEEDKPAPARVVPPSMERGITEARRLR